MRVTALAQVAQRCCGISISGDIKKLFGCPGDQLWVILLEQMTLTGPFPPQPTCDCEECFVWYLKQPCTASPATVRLTWFWGEALGVLVLNSRAGGGDRAVTTIPWLRPAALPAGSRTTTSAST